MCIGLCACLFVLVCGWNVHVWVDVLSLTRRTIRFIFLLYLCECVFVCFEFLLPSDALKCSLLICSFPLFTTFHFVSSNAVVVHFEIPYISSSSSRICHFISDQQTVNISTSKLSHLIYSNEKKRNFLLKMWLFSWTVTIKYKREKKKRVVWWK